MPAKAWPKSATVVISSDPTNGEAKVSDIKVAAAHQAFRDCLGKVTSKFKPFPLSGDYVVVPQKGPPKIARAILTYSFTFQFAP